MADGLSMSMIVKPTTDAMADMAKRTDRATMWAIRETGRQIKREARREAPVYKGSRAHVSFAAARSARRGYGKFTARDVRTQVQLEGGAHVSGMLKNSISSSKRLKKGADGSYRIAVGPRGERVHLYAGKVEATTKPYMRIAYDRVTPTMVQIHAKAWERAMAKKK